MPKKNSTQRQQQAKLAEKARQEQRKRITAWMERAREQGAKIAKLVAEPNVGSRKYDALTSALVELSNQTQICIDHPRLVEMFYFEAMFELLKHQMRTGEDLPTCVSDIEVLLGNPNRKTVDRIRFSYCPNLEREEAAARKKASRKAVSRG